MALITILGIESSCDETAAAVVSANFESESVSTTGKSNRHKIIKKQILSNVIYSQIFEHEPFNGVVPEIAARAHLEKIDIVVKRSLENAKIKLSDLDAVAGTCGPGLIGGVIVGATFAKGISLASGIPFIAINHIEAHALTIRLTEESVNFPYLLILASGGHCQICIVHSCCNFEIIGSTLDDSLGESFDKVSKMLGFGYPGGPALEKCAEKGDETRFLLPKPLCTKNNMDFSFSGLKTAVRMLIEKTIASKEQHLNKHVQSSELDGRFKADISASFQRTVTDILIYKMYSALKYCENKGVVPTATAIAGGVAANKHIREKLKAVCEERKMRFLAPPINLCTDNGAMIAWAGIEKFVQGKISKLDFKPRPRWQCAREDSNFRPSPPEGDALSS